MTGQPQRILMTADAIGGVWTYALDLMRTLSDLEFAFCVMGSAPTAAQQNQLELLDNVTCFISDYQLEWMDEPWADVDAAGGWLLDIASDFEPDLVHLNGYSHAALPWPVGVVVAAHSCVVSWWQSVKREEPPGRFTEYRERVTRGLAAADIIIAPSRWMLSALGENYGREFQGTVIHNGCRQSVFGSATKADVIFSAGRLWDEAKNLRALDAAAAHVSWPTDIAGQPIGPTGDEVKLGHARGLGSLPSSEVARLMQRAAIFALPARYEPFGLSALEAAGNGCALVLGDIPSLRELWENSALFVDPDDHHGLVCALNRLVADAELRTDLGRRALRRAGDFTAGQMAEKYRRAYSECVRSKSVKLAA
jgi:glycogen synthase